MDRTACFAPLRRRTSGVFGTSLSQSQVDGINGILDAFATHGDGRDKTLAYALATAYHETGARMVPVREGFAKDDVALAGSSPSASMASLRANTAVCSMGGVRSN